MVVFVSSGARLMLRNLSTLLIALSTTVSTGADEVTFEGHVRPILKAHCFQCHGEDGEKEGGLDLRLRRFIAAGGESGPAFDSNAPATSLLLERVRSGEMPPGDDKRLSEADVRTIEAWISTGAKTAREEPKEVGNGPLFTEEERNYWAFQPVHKPAIPKLSVMSRVRTPIDAFLLAEMRSDESFAPDADRFRLVRRAWFDLAGLPPTPEAVAAFVDDQSPDAWERLVNQLLASPQYGERWGRHWLDVAGYADSEGYTDDDRVRGHAFRYRDYVIRAFNSDKPFDEFIREQLAGDEMVPLPHKNMTPDSIEKLTATGFLRMAPDGTASSGIDQSVARNQVIADTMQIVGTSLLGLTVNCAQCHDHRYDPIPTVDYYRMRAVFEPGLDWKKWRTPPTRQISLYTDVDIELAKSIEAEAVVVEQERQKKADGYITRTLEEELLLVLEETREALRTAYRAVAKDRNDEQKALLKEYPSVASISVGSLYLYDQRRDERARKLDTDRVAKEKQFVTETVQRELEKVNSEQRAEVEAALNTAADKRSDEQKALLKKYPGVLVTSATLAQFNPEAAAELELDGKTAMELRSSKAAVDLKSYADRAAEIRATKPKEGFLRTLTEVTGTVPATFVFYRGDHEQPKDKVLPGALSILGAGPEIAENDSAVPTTGRRLAFARHLTSGDHPLVARVIANRIWLHHFGRGLVDSPGDFGVLGQRPTHPQLLDWLASELVHSGWSVKHLHRLIMSSTVYQQSSVSKLDSQDADSLPALYSSFPVRRLESEVIRDAVLAVTGRLNSKLYGEAVPVMEDGVGRVVIGQENLDGERKPTKTIDLDGEEFRRSVYVQVRRSRTLSMFETFDAPTMSPNCDRRSFSTVTPQSLLMMNSDFSVEYSNHLARRVINEVGEDVPLQVAFAWQLAFAKAPSDDELNEAVDFVYSQRPLIAAADKNIKAEDAAREALGVFCQVLLSSSRFLYVD
jgi:mono/diheme cytochrome c family protein